MTPKPRIILISTKRLDHYARTPSFPISLPKFGLLAVWSVLSRIGEIREIRG